MVQGVAGQKPGAALGFYYIEQFPSQPFFVHLPQGKRRRDRTCVNDKYDEVGSHRIRHI